MPRIECGQLTHHHQLLRIVLPILLVITPALAAVEPIPVGHKKLAAISVLPDGSQLHGVMLPRYDENHRLLGVLQARAMTLINDQTISGQTVTVEFFNPDGSPRGRADLNNAVYNQALGTLEAKNKVTIKSDRLHAIGCGLSYVFTQNQGFLLGPVITWLQNPTASTMNTSHSSSHTAALVGVALLTSPLSATPPVAITPTERAAVQADAASTAATASQAATTTGTELAADVEAATAASTAAHKFVAQSGLAAVDNTQTSGGATPLELQPDPDATIVRCDGGMYFDADKGVLVYLKNVRVTDPRFTLSGANELKIFLGKKPETKATKPETKPETKPLGDDLGNKFSDVERIIATGAVRVVQKQPAAGKEPIEASGAIFTYHTATGQIILQGGYPWVKQGSNFMRAAEPNLSLRILKTGSFITEGKWEMGGKIEQKR